MVERPGHAEVEGAIAGVVVEAGLDVDVFAGFVVEGQVHSGLVALEARALEPAEPVGHLPQTHRSVQLAELPRPSQVEGEPVFGVGVAGFAPSGGIGHLEVQPGVLSELPRAIDTENLLVG